MATTPQQQSCKGVLLWQQGGQAATCYGVASTLRDSFIDLHGHAETRVQPAGVPSTHRAHLSSLSCVGQAVYQHADASSPLAAVPPPACIGIEFVRYAQLAQQQQQLQQQQQAVPEAHAGRPQHLTAAAAPSDLELLPPSDAHNQHLPAAEHQAGPFSTTSGGGGGFGPAVQQEPAEPAAAAGPPQGRLGVVERLQALHADVSERLEGQDPWWFGKAFLARAELNLGSMKATAGEMMVSALVDLGLKQPPKEDSRE